MAVEIGTAYVSIVPSARGFGAALDKAMVPAAAAAGDEAGAAASGAFGRRLSLGIAAGVTAAAGGLVALGKKASTMGLKTAAANEQAAISFTKFTGSVGKATSMLNDLKRFAADTPFEFPELQETSRMLLVAGFSAEQVMPMLRNLGDVVSSTGKGSEGMRRAAIALQQMAASGKIYAEDLNQLRDAGVPVFELLQGATGKTKEEIMDMVRAGQLGGEALQQVFDALVTGKGLERFVGVMEQQSKTLLGLWSSLKDNLGQGLAEAMTPAVASIVTQMPAINEAVKAGIGEIGPVLTRAVTTLIDTLAALMPVIAPLLADTGSVLVDFLSGIGSIVKEMGGMFGFLAQVIAQNVIGAFVELLPEIRDLAKALGPIIIAGVRFAMLLTNLLAPALSAILHNVEPLVRVLATGMLVAFDRLSQSDLEIVFVTVADAVVELVNAAMPLVDVFVAFVDQAASELIAMLPGVVTGFVELARSLIPLVPAFAVLARDLAPILLDVLARYLPILLRTAEVLVPLWVAWMELRTLWYDLWLRVLRPFVPALAHLAEVVLPLLERILVPVVETMVRWVDVLSQSNAGLALLIALLTAGIGFKLITQLVLSVVQGYNLLTVLALVNAAYVGVGAAAAEAAAAEAAGTTITLWSRVATGIEAARNQSLILRGIMIGLNVIMSPWFYIPVLIIAIGAAFLIAYNDIKPFHDAVDALWASFQRGLDVIKELIGLLWSGDFTRAGEIVSDIGGRIVDSLANLGNTIKDKVSEWALAFWEGLQAIPPLVATWFTDTLVPAIVSWLTGLGNLFKWLFTQVGPYLVFGAIRMVASLTIWLLTTAIPWLIRTGWSLMAALIGWIKDAAPAALEALVGFLQAIGPWLTGTAVPWITEKALALKDAFLAWLSEAVPTAIAALRGWLSQVGDWITGTAIPAVTAFVSEFGGAFLGWLVDIVPKVVVGLWNFYWAAQRWISGTAVPGFVRFGLAIAGALLGFLRDLPGRIASGLATLLSNLPGWIATAAAWIAEKAVALGQALWGWIAEAVPPLLAQLGVWLSAAGGWITGTAVPWLTDKALALGSALLGWLGDVVPQVLAGLGAVLAAIGGWIIGTGIPALINASVWLFSALLSFMQELPDRIAGGIEALFANVPGWIATAAVFIAEKAVALGSALIGWIAETLPKLLAKLGEWLVTAGPWIAEKAGALASSLWGWIAETVPMLLEKLGGLLEPIGAWITGTALPAIGEKAGQLAGALTGWIAEIGPQLPGKLLGVLQTIGVWIAEDAIPFLISKGLSLLATMVLWAVKLAIELPILLVKAQVAIGIWIGKAVVWLVIQAAKLGAAFMDWLTRLPNRMSTLLRTAQIKIAEWIVAVVPWLWEKAQQLEDAITSWLINAVTAIPGLLAQGLANIWAWIAFLVPWLWEKAIELQAAIVGWIVNAVASVPGLVGGFLAKIWEWISTFVPELLIKVGELERALLAWIVNAIAAAPAKLEEWGASLLGFITGLPAQIADAAKGMFDGIANAFIAAVNWIIRTWNDVKLEIPEVEILGKKIGGFTLETNNIDEIASIGSFAMGGRPPLNRASLVGELGPELFVPDRLGTIVPNDALAPGRGSGFNVGKIEVSGQDTPQATAFAIRSELHWLSMLAGAT